MAILEYRDENGVEVPTVMLVRPGLEEIKCVSFPQNQLHPYGNPLKKTTLCRILANVTLLFSSGLIFYRSIFPYLRLSRLTIILFSVNFTKLYPHTGIHKHIRTGFSMFYRFLIEY